MTIATEETTTTVDATEAAGAVTVTTGATEAAHTAGVHRGEAKGNTATEREAGEAARVAERTAGGTSVRRLHRALLRRPLRLPVPIQGLPVPPPLRILQSRRIPRHLTLQGRRGLRIRRALLLLLPHKRENKHKFIR